MKGTIFFSAIVENRFFFSFVIYCIILPVGQRSTCSKLTLPTKCLGNSRKEMSKATDSLNEIIWVTLWENL